MHWRIKKRIKKLNTIAIKPETSHREKPMKAHLINWSTTTVIGLREIDKTKLEKINPTPIATPAREINGILEAKNLKPNKTKAKPAIQLWETANENNRII